MKDEDNSKLELQWRNEKKFIDEMKDLGKELDNFKEEAQQAERTGELQKAAKIIYGEIHELEQKIKIAEGKLA